MVVIKEKFVEHSWPIKQQMELDVEMRTGYTSEFDPVTKIQIKVQFHCEGELRVVRWLLFPIWQGYSSAPESYHYISLK